MDRQIFSDGIGQITVIGGTVRLDFLAYSATEKDAHGQPAAVLCQRVIMSAEGFLQSAGKIQETVQAMSKLAKRPQPAPDADPEPAGKIIVSPATDGTPAKRPFP